MIAGLVGTEAITAPVLVDRARTLLAVDGPLRTSPLAIGMGVLALGWPLCLFEHRRRATGVLRSLGRSILRC
jgi:hypothetical protein